MEEIREKFKSITEKINKAGGKLYLVGGAVRDIYLGKKPKDLDFCVCHITAEKFKELFQDAIVIGKAFPVFKYLDAEFSLARIEKSIGNKHKDFTFCTDVNIKIEEDLIRRDITINSLAIDMQNGEVIDCFNAKEDINNKVIRKISDAFLEDPNRVYRVARFAATLDFKVEEETICYMHKMKENLKYVPVEVVFQELNKALQGKRPSNFFNVLRKANLLDVHFKEINDLIGVIQPAKYHPEGDAYIHTMKVIDYVANKKTSALCVFSALLHDLGKAKTPKEILPKHIGHEESGIPLVKSLCKRLKVPNKYLKSAEYICRNHMRIARYHDMKIPKRVDVLQSISKTYLTVEEVETIVNADNSMITRDNIMFSKDYYYIQKINGKYIKEKYPNLEGVKYPEKIREERIKILKK